MKVCPRCERRPRKTHWNTRWCAPCAAELRRCPAGKLTPAQGRQVKRLAGTMRIKDLAKRVGTSDSNLDRWARDNGVDLRSNVYPDHVVQEVCAYYARHGKIKAQKKFPGVRVRSIVERYTHEPRQVRWTADQLIELAQMGGLVSFEHQARLFNRPNARAGSIKAAHNKIFGRGLGAVNGLSHHIAKHYVMPSCPVYETNFWVTERGRNSHRRRLALWIDVAIHLRDDIPDHLASAIQTMARFQRWLHGPHYHDSILYYMNLGST